MHRLRNRPWKSCRPTNEKMQMRKKSSAITFRSCGKDCNKATTMMRRPELSGGSQRRVAGELKIILACVREWTTNNYWKRKLTFDTRDGLERSQHSQRSQEGEILHRTAIGHQTEKSKTANIRKKALLTKANPKNVLRIIENDIKYTNGTNHESSHARTQE